MINSIITFLPSKDNDAMSNFYGDLLEMSLHKDQGKCRIYECNNAFVGFCNHYENSDPVGVVCFVLSDKTQVNKMYQKCLDNDINVINEPIRKSEFGIYQFYAYDPSDNRVEFQCFL